VNLLILGANSDVAQAVARRFAGRKADAICLASRDTGLLAKRGRDIALRTGVKMHTCFFDAADTASYHAFYDNLPEKPDMVVLAFGHMEEQDTLRADFSRIHQMVMVNFVGAASILEIVAADFEKRQGGMIVGISSVAGERGRRSNYLYGASKSALTTLLSGLRNRLRGADVRVMTVLPGFIRTKMTEHLDLPGLLTASPEQVAEDIARGVEKGRDILYTRWFWRWIMMIIRWIPERVFKRLDL